MTVNRQCSSGLQAVANIAQAIMAGTIEIGIGAGVESMTRHYGPGAMPEGMSQTVMEMPLAADSLMPMGITSENVAAKFKVDRQKQDRFSVASHQKAAAAQRAGKFKDEIVPVEIGGKLVTEDDGIRADASYEGLAKLKPAFREDGTTTAGNSSQVSDGAAAVLLMKRKTAQRLGLPVKAKFLAFATAGVPPAIMGIGPAVAIPKALEKAGLSISDIGVFEINEAFASQAVYSVEKLGIDMAKVNPNGGAIALGHPLGCTGARQIATLLPELKRCKAKYAVTSMCIGTGMGASAVFENEQ
jgi:acetyl-CoA acyltransferase 1